MAKIFSLVRIFLVEWLLGRSYTSEVSGSIPLWDLGQILFFFFFLFKFFEFLNITREKKNQNLFKKTFLMC